uniref:Uncharacterized protein n=1 Tax=Oryza nivara TaxID=4536 RepID=A0A0E0I858_ORYNI
MHLDHLDIRRCYNVDMDAALRAKCARIKALKLPRDCTDGDESFRIGDTQLSLSFLRRDRTLTNSHLLGAMPRSPSPRRRRRRRRRGTGRTCRGTR